MESTFLVEHSLKKKGTWLTWLPQIDTLFRSSPLSKNVNKDKKNAWDGGVKRAVHVITTASKGGHKTEVARVFAERKSPIR